MATHQTTKQSFADKCIRDSNGKVVLGQSPNLPILGWIVFYILAKLSTGQLSFASAQVARAFLFTWAYLEIVEGVNYFRRLLGAIVMAMLVVSFIST